MTRLKDDSHSQNDLTAVESKPDLLLQYLVSNNKPEIMECANCEEVSLYIFRVCFIPITFPEGLISSPVNKAYIHGTSLYQGGANI